MFDIEFNPKGSNLLDEQLAISGLEMNIVEVFAGISAAASVVGGIFGANQASKNNKRAKRNRKKQKRFNKQVAERTNRYNAQVLANQEANYHAMRDFNHDVAMANWRRGKQIQDYEYDAAMKQYEKSQAIGAAQLGLNSREAAAAIESEELALHDAYLEQQFGIADSKADLADELQRQNLNRQSVNLDRKQANVEGSLGRQEQRNRLKIAGQQADIDFASQRSSMQQTYAQQDLGTRESLTNLSGELGRQNINRQEQYAQLQSIRSRKSTGAQSIENTIDQLTSSSNFEKESAMVEGLLAEGRASLGQAGKSTAKAKQSARAALQRSLMSLASEVSGKRKQAGIQLAELNAELSLAETGVGLNLQRIDAAVSGAQAATGLNIERINTQVRGAEREAQLAARRTDMDLMATKRDAELQTKRINAAQRFALEGAAIQEQGINYAIDAANRDYLQNMEVLRANYDSAKAQTEINIEAIGIQKEVADLNTEAAMMIKPERLPYDPEPMKPPEHIFLEAMEAVPGFVPSPPQQSVFAPILQGIASGAGVMSSPGLFQGQGGSGR